MSQTWKKRAGVSIIAGALAATSVGAEELAEQEPLKHAHVSVVAPDGLLVMRGSAFGEESASGPSTSFLNVGASIRSADAGRGWLAGADVSILALAADTRGLVRDNSSSLFVRYRPWSWNDGEEAALTLYPLSATRLRMGWAYPATWGGNAFVSKSQSLQQGLRVGVTRERWYAFAAVKSAAGYEGQSFRWAPMAGVGVSLLPSLRLEAHGAFISHGTSSMVRLAPIEYREDVRGASARLHYQVGEPVGASVDFGLYRNAPELYEQFLTPETYPGGAAWSVSIEGSRAYRTTVVQSLDTNTPGTTSSSQTAGALALEARIKIDRLRVHAVGFARNAAFILLDKPLASPGGFTPDVGVTTGADYYFPAAKVTPGVVLGIERPATELEFHSAWPPALVGPTGTGILDGATGKLRRIEDGLKPELTLSARANLKWEMASWASLVGELAVSHDFVSGDSNSYWIGSPGESAPPRWTQTALGLNLLFQARY